MYFFHLKLELYDFPAASKRLQVASTASPRRYILPKDSDIFRTPLPAHRTSKWSSYNFSERSATPPSSSTTSIDSPAGIKPGEQLDSHGDTLLLPERTLNRSRAPKSPSYNTERPSNETAAKDWRYNAVSIESIDMEVRGGTAKRMTDDRVKSGTNALHTKALYIPSDPKTTDVGWGVVHLYRDSEESTIEESQGAHVAFQNLHKARQHADIAFNPDDCATLCILAVPSWMMPSDLLGFVGDEARENVSHFRLIRTERTNKYMVLMRFRSSQKAKDWQRINNGRLFSAAEPENCHVVFIKSVEFINSQSEDGEGAVKSFPQNTHDPFTPAYPGGTVSRAEKTLSSKPMAPPPPNLLELPTCPVCLERMDETTGLLTILCQHVFHCACLEKWRFTGSGCPVCRYTQNPSHTFPYPRPTSGGTAADGEEAEPICSVCATNVNVNLWVCLICGNIGCGRYDSAHAYAHYEATSHCYAMDISTQRVWDYAGDGYVHRLIQSKPDFTAPQKHGASGLRDSDNADRMRHENEAYRAEGDDVVPREKMESMANEYTYLLTSQLEGQRRYFEEQVERAVDKASEASTKADVAASRANHAVEEMEASKAERDSLRAVVQRLEKALEKSDKSKAKFEQMAREMSTQLREEKVMNEGLLKRIKAADEKMEEAKAEARKASEEKKDLEEMNHDLTMFISSQEKVKELQAQGEDVIDGSVSVPEPQKKKGKGRKK